MRDEQVIARDGYDELVRVGSGFFATYWHRHIEDRITYQTSSVVSRRRPMGYYASDEEAVREWRRRLEQEQAKGDRAREQRGQVVSRERVSGR